MAEIYSFGYWVLRRRKALDLTRVELAQRVSCSPETIKKIERDERRPSRQVANLLANALVLPPEEKPLFLQAARGERSVDRLCFVSQPLLPSLLKFPNPSALQTPFVGRKNEIETITELILDPACRLLTIIGPGGIGKTRLAVEVGHSLVQHKPDLFRDGLIFIHLASLRESAALLSTIATSLNFSFQDHGFALRDQLANYLCTKQILLILDNYEHLIDDEGLRLPLDLLCAAPSMKILITSRVPLNLRGEQVVNVTGMDIPPDKTNNKIASYEAVQLFISTADRISKGFALTDENKTSIVNICKLVEGMPLAIELAASWTRTRSCAEIEREIEHSLDILASTMQDVPERHRSFRAAFQSSWHLLSEEEKGVFSALSVFRGGFHFQAAREIVGADEITLAALINKSLLRRAASGRYDMNELLRRFAEEKLNDTQKAHQFHDRHLSFYLRLAEELGSESSGAAEKICCSLEREYDNFRTALKWALANKSLESGLRLASALDPFWNDNGYLEEGAYWLSNMLDTASNQSPTARATVLIQSAALACNQEIMSDLFY